MYVFKDGIESLTIFAAREISKGFKCRRVCEGCVFNLDEECDVSLCSSVLDDNIKGVFND